MNKNKETKKTEVKQNTMKKDKKTIGINGEVIDFVMGTYTDAQKRHVERCKQVIKHENE